MDEAKFLGVYADSRLTEWWNAAAPPSRAEMLALLTGMHATPLTQLDQFTVGLHTGQPDGWEGPRLVFAIRNNVLPSSKATRHTFCVSVALTPQAIAISVIPELDPDHQQGNQRQALSPNQSIACFHERKLALRKAVDRAIEQRRVNGRTAPRAARWPSEYQLAS
jgi:hypothetical protein